jgi:hypothetical protein
MDVRLDVPLYTQHLTIGPSALSAILDVPDECDTLALIVPARGCSRHVRRDNDLAAALRRRGCATLVVDYVDERMARACSPALLAVRLGEVLDWIDAVPLFAPLPLLLVCVDAIDAELDEVIAAHGGRAAGLRRIEAEALLAEPIAI